MDLPSDIIIPNVLPLLDTEDIVNFLSTCKEYDELKNHQQVLKILLLSYVKGVNTPTLTPNTNTTKKIGDMITKNCTMEEVVEGGWKGKIKKEIYHIIGRGGYDIEGCKVRFRTKEDLCSTQGVNKSGNGKTLMYVPPREEGKKFAITISSHFLDTVLETIPEEEYTALANWVKLEKPNLHECISNEYFKEFFKNNEELVRNHIFRLISIYGDLPDRDQPMWKQYEKLLEYRKKKLVSKLDLYFQKPPEPLPQRRTLPTKYTAFRSYIRDDTIRPLDSTNPVDYDNLMKIFRKGKKFTKKYLGHIQYCMNIGLEFIDF